MSPPPRPCPRDPADHLGTIDTQDGLSVDFCGGCGGSFFGEGELHRFAGLPDGVDFLVEGREVGPGPACPGCGELMTEVFWPPEGSLKLDVCPRGEVWLDRGEAAQLRAELKDITAARWHQVQAGEELFEVPLRPLAEVAGPRDLRWLVGSVGIILVCQVVVVGLLRIAWSVVVLGDGQGWSETGMLGAAMLLGFALGGFLSGRFSEGFTVWEPAVAAVPAALLFALLFWASFGLPTLVLLLAAGVLVTMAGALAGERAQGH